MQTFEKTFFKFACSLELTYSFRMEQLKLFKHCSPSFFLCFLDSIEVIGLLLLIKLLVNLAIN